MGQIEEWTRRFGPEWTKLLGGPEMTKRLAEILAETPAERAERWRVFLETERETKRNVRSAAAKQAAADARRRGDRLGRRPKLSEAKQRDVCLLLASGKSVRWIAKRLGASPAGVQRLNPRNANRPQTGRQGQPK
jgi:DNA-binding NarL/FixJ family response regulator